MSVLVEIIHWVRDRTAREVKLACLRVLGPLKSTGEQAESGEPVDAGWLVCCECWDVAWLNLPRYHGVFQDSDCKRDGSWHSAGSDREVEQDE
jgi:hypothetical protein